jgi:hypothetical protein
LAAGPLRLTTKVHPLLKSAPLRVPHHPSTVRPVGRTNSLRFLLPPTTSLGLAPYEAGSGPFPPRFHSQACPPCGRLPLSGFLAGPSFAALFHAATVPGILPSESFPHSSRAPLSGPHAPLQLSTDVLRRCCQDLVTAGFLDARALTRLPDSPDDYRFPFHAPRHASRSPWVQAAEPSRSASFTYFEAFILLRVRSRYRGLPHANGRSSPGFLPL